MGKGALLRSSPPCGARISKPESAGIDCQRRTSSMLLSFRRPTWRRAMRATMGRPAVPDERLEAAQYRKFGMLPFGISEYRDLFTPRQLAVAVALCEAVREARAEMLASGSEAERATAVATYLGLLIGRIVDYNSSFCSWNLGRELTRIPLRGSRSQWSGISRRSIRLQRCRATGPAAWFPLRGRSSGAPPRELVRLGSCVGMPKRSIRFRTRTSMRLLSIRPTTTPSSTVTSPTTSTSG